MAKKVVALSLASLLTGAAWCQSRVEIFGVLDLRVSRISNDGGGHLNALNSAGITTSQLGFRGREELGGGAYTGFHLETLLRPDMGTTGAGFNRRSTVSLGNHYGELRLGRDTTPSYRMVTKFDPFIANGLGADINVLSAGPAVNGAPATRRTGTYNQISNTVTYLLPGGEKGGWYGSMMYAFGEATTSNRYRGANLGWVQGALTVAAHAAETKPFNAVPLRHRTVGIAAAYDFPTGTRVMGQYHRERTARTAAVDYREPWWLIGVVHAFGANEFRASYVHKNAHGTTAESGSDASLWAIGYSYNFSKRTAIYANHARLTNRGTSAIYIPNGPTTITAGGQSRGLDVGIRHRF